MCLRVSLCVCLRLYSGQPVSTAGLCAEIEEREREGETGKEGGGSGGGEEVRGRAGWMCLMVDLTRRLGAGI